MKDDNSNKRIITATKTPAPKAPPKQINITNETTIILRTQSSLDDEDIETLEGKYSKKFGCKVVILEANLQFVDTIDG